MTQSSRPNADHVANYPTSDAGPYSRDQWAELFYILFTADQRATQGPLIRYSNELEVTNPAGVTIRVDTGAGMCTGTGLINSATVDFTPTTPLIGDRIDKVVMCLNNTNATYNTNLEFPTVLTDYDLTASIEPYSCRLAILTGVDGGAARAPVQTANYYMVELARYTITMAPAISVGPTDYRDFCETPMAAIQALDETILTAPAASVSFLTISQTHRNLKIVYQARSDRAAANDITTLRFNADAGNNYDYTENKVANGVLAGTTANGVNTIDAGTISAATATASYSSGYVIDIPNYRGATFYKTAIVQGGYLTAQTNVGMSVVHAVGWWRSTVAITRIDLIPTFGNFIAGSTFVLYGER